MKIVSGKTGSPHVTSHEFRQIIEGTIGQESYILKSGDNLEPELVSNNLLKIKSGMMSHHGNVSSVENYDEIELTNGTQGMKRIDLIVNRYTRNDETKIENNSWICIVGTPDASSPTVPSYTAGNLQEGDLIDDCPVLQISYDGINVTEVKKLLSVAKNSSEMESEITELNRKLPKVEKNSDGNDIIDTGYSKIAVGTMVTNAIIDSKNQSYAQMFSADQIKRKLNLDTFDFSKFSINVYNGDPNAAYTHLYNAEWWSGIGAYFVYMYPNTTGSVRINYRIEYFYM